MQLPFVRVIAAAITALMFAAGGASAEPLKIRIGWVVTPAQLTPMLFKKKEILKHYGKSYVVDPIRFRGSSLQISALAAGEIDIAALSYSAFALAIQNANMKDIRAIADVFQDGVKDHFTVQYMVKKDSPIKTVKDLKGKQIATNAVGGAVDIAMRKYLREHGLEDKKDYTVTEARFPNMGAMLEEKKVDMIGILVPFSGAVEAKGARTVFTMKDAMGPSQMIFWTARDEFLKKNHDALVDFFEDQQRALRWYLDPANRKEALAIIGGFTKRPPKSFDPWLFTKKDFYRDPNSELNVEALRKNIALQHELGFLKQKINVDEYVDMSLVKEAGKRLN